MPARPACNPLCATWIGSRTPGSVRVTAHRSRDCKVGAYHLRFPAGDDLVHLHFSIGVKVQLKDAIDRNSIPVPLGAVLSWSIELSVVLENTPCRPGRANIALYGVGTMRGPGPQW